MKKNYKYVCPETRSELKLTINKENNGNVVEGYLENVNGKKYPIIDGIPILVYPEELHQEEKNIINWYSNNYEVYDEYLPLTFETFKVDEREERNKMIKKLKIKKEYKILETGAGTGRDSVLLAEKLGNEGELYVTDIYENILRKSIKKLDGFETNIAYSVINAHYLPFPDNYFDIYYHFGGFNTFSDKKKAFKEISRVVKSGGQVIVGDESIPPWLSETEFGRILKNSNPHYNYPLPIEYMDFTSRNVEIKYIIGGAFYFIYYTVGEGEPYADFDFEIPGIRGGTHRTRYYGKMEGVEIETKELVYKAAQKSGKSIHKWLDDVIKKEAEKEINNE